MSDLLTDMRTNERRRRIYYHSLKLIAEYLTSKRKDKRKYKKIIEAAKSFDALNPGFWDGPTSLAEYIVEKIGRLEDNDLKEWGTLLIDAYGNNYAAFEKLKPRSPFAGTAFIYAKVKDGAIILRGELDKLIEELYGQGLEKNEQFVLSIPGLLKKDLDDVSVVRLRKPKTKP